MSLKKLYSAYLHIANTAIRYASESFQGIECDRWKDLRPQEGFVATSYEQREAECTERGANTGVNIAPEHRWL